MFFRHSDAEATARINLEAKELTIQSLTKLGGASALSAEERKNAVKSAEKFSFADQWAVQHQRWRKRTQQRRKTPSRTFVTLPLPTHVRITASKRAISEIETQIMRTAMALIELWDLTAHPHSRIPFHCPCYMCGLDWPNLDVIKRVVHIKRYARY